MIDCPSYHASDEEWAAFVEAHKVPPRDPSKRTRKGNRQCLFAHTDNKRKTDSESIWLDLDRPPRRYT